VEGRLQAGNAFIMLFNSLPFLLFFSLVYAIYITLNHRAQNFLLLGASYVFYAWWDWRFCFLMLFSTLVDYVAARRIDASSSPRERRFFLVLSLCTNLGLLGIFKYFNFFLDSTIALLGAAGFEAHMVTLQILLPVGISFYTFQSMSYTIDIYRREMKPVYNFFDFALYVSFFPQLVAGPIERARRLLPQVMNPRVIRQEDIAEGVWLILLGYFKKVVIADNFATIANTVFDNPGDYQGLAILIGVYAFAFQIYGDFSGYSDIARGTARLLGFNLMLNFRMPYFSASPQEFWRRWHISLSTWLRDYLYVSLGGNKASTLFTYRNLMLTMLLGGLWHGAAWNFVLWGLYQGLLLIVHRLYRSIRPAKDGVSPLLKAFQIAIMFQFVCLGWVLFRVNEVADVAIILRQLAHFEFSHFPWLLGMLVYLWPLLLLQWAKERSDDMLVVFSWPPWLRLAVYGLLMAYIGFAGKVDGDEFIYFQF